MALLLDEVYARTQQLVLLVNEEKEELANQNEVIEDIKAFDYTSLTSLVPCKQKVLKSMVPLVSKNRSRLRTGGAIETQRSTETLQAHLFGHNSQQNLNYPQG